MVHVTTGYVYKNRRPVYSTGQKLTYAGLGALAIGGAAYGIHKYRKSKQAKREALAKAANEARANNSKTPRK